MGTSFFGAVAPDNFATFDSAFVTLFYVTGGDPWPDSLPKHNDDGSTNWEVSARPGPIRTRTAPFRLRAAQRPAAQAADA